MAVLLLIVLILASCLVLRVAVETICVYWLTPRRIRQFMEKQGVRGPHPRFLVGNLFHMASLVQETTSSDMGSVHHDIVGRLLPHYVLWSKLYGKRFIYWWGVEPRMCLSETELIKELLSAKNSQVYGKSWLQRQGAKHFIGKGLLMANGEEWVHQRHIAAPAFQADKLKGRIGHMVDCTRRALQCLRSAAESGQTEVEINGFFNRLTADIICRTEFDINYEKGKKIFDLLTTLQHHSSKASRHLWFPGSRFFPSRYNREIKRVKVEIEYLLMQIIERRRDGVEIGRSASYGNGLLGLLLEQVENKNSKSNFTIQHLIDECKTFFFTGHETTGLLLTWTVMLLACNPSWQEKAREEVLRVCQGSPPSADHLTKLPLLGMILNESLRLYPPAALLPRQAFEDTMLGDLQIPKGLSIWIPVLAIHHSEELWGKDANEFNPERFAGRSFASGRHFMPFAAGPRNCIGQAFAIMEAKVVLAMLLSSFSFTVSHNYRHAPVYVLTLKPKHGVQIDLKPLQ
ncbi:cytokinin hydroxylase-like [Nymphaea colorata]|nr:cytokinin hydroxylase-like [Nymphaea colorata]